MQLDDLDHKKHLRRNFLIISAILLGSITLGLIKSDKPVAPQVSGVVTEEEIVVVPMPTEINANFMTQVDDCFLPTASIYGYTLRITSAFRSVEEQNQLFEQGRTVDGHIVTDIPGGLSIHNFGYAIDIVDRFRGFDINWERLAKIATFCGIEQGQEGDWAHFEYRNGLARADFESGKRPPLLELPCDVMYIRALNEQKLTLKDLQDCGAPNFNQ